VRCVCIMAASREGRFRDSRHESVHGTGPINAGKAGAVLQSMHRAESELPVGPVGFVYFGKYENDP